MDRDSAYYYDDEGKPVPLEVDERLAVDLKAAAAIKIDPQILKVVEERGLPLRGGVFLIEPDELPAEARHELESTNAVLPTFRSEDAVLIVLPELRIESDDESTADEVRKYLEQAEIPSEVVRTRAGQMVIRPTTGLGSDALALANAVEEALHPPMAQARFLRMVSRPGIDADRSSDVDEGTEEANRG